VSVDEQEPDGCSDGDPEQEALSDAHQAVGSKQQDSLIGFAALGQRLEDIELALFPCPRRRRQIGHHSTGGPPHADSECDAAKR
jgi:hypothetical protein